MASVAQRQPAITANATLQGPSQPTQALAAQQLITVENDTEQLFPDTPGDCSWAEVMGSMEAASQEYKAKGETNRMRAMQRNRAVAATLQSLGDMIPEQDGLSILRGGLNGIFKLLKKRIDNGERILAAFEDIPITFCEACHALIARPTDEPLRSLVRDLYLTVREEVTKLTEILLRKHKGSLSRRILRQHPENEAANIEQSLELINRASRRVSVRVSNLANETMVETLRETRNVNQEMSKAQSALAELRQSQLEMERNSMARYEQQELLAHAFVESINQSLQQCLGGCESQFRMGFSGMQEALQELMWYAQPLLPQLSPNMHASMMRRSPSPCGHCEIPVPLAISVSMSYDELYMLLRLPDPFFLAKDLGLVLRASSAMDPQGSSRGAWLLNMDRFKAWAQIPNRLSDLLLVDGHLGEYCRGKISPLSVISAIFTSMSKIPHFVILTHFCGLHTNPADPMSGCRGMLRSLIAQLIVDQRSLNSGTRVSLDELVLEAITQHDLDALCQLFQALLAQMHPEVTVYCVLDDISQFETTLEGWNEELSRVVHMLQGISRRRWGTTFKVLLTAANRSISVFRQIEPGDIISLSAGNRSSRSIQRLSIESGWTRALSPG